MSLIYIVSYMISYKFITAYPYITNNLQVLGTSLLLINDVLIIIDRSLKFIEDYINNEVLPLYANTHTETSQCSHQMTQFREEARYVTLTIHVHVIFYCL